MKKEQPTRKAVDESPYRGEFGYCPRCWDEDGILENGGDLPFGPDTYFGCEKHKLMWCAGSNLTSSWRRKSRDEVYNIAKTYFENYEQTEPYLVNSTTLVLERDAEAGATEGRGK